MSQQIQARHPSSVVFLLHIALEIPVAIQGLLSPTSLPLLQLNNTTVLLLKLYSALAAGTCAAALLCFGLPEFLPGKRALGIGLAIYHLTCSTILYNAPRVIPHSFGGIAESFNVTPERLWGVLHGFLGLGIAIWWQLTVQMAAAFRKMQ